MSRGMLALRECLRVCPPELAGSCMRLPAMAVPDGWPPARASGCTEPGLQVTSPAACCRRLRHSAAKVKKCLQRVTSWMLYPRFSLRSNRESLTTIDASAVRYPDLFLKVTRSICYRILERIPKTSEINGNRRPCIEAAANHRYGLRRTGLLGRQEHATCRRAADCFRLS